MDAEPWLFSMRNAAMLGAVGFVVLAWRVALAPPKPPPKVGRPWEQRLGSAVVLAVRGNAFGTLSYLYGCETSGVAAIVDATGHADLLLAEARARGLSVVALLQTHAHLDHVQALPDYARLLPGSPAPRLHPGDVPMLRTHGIPIPRWGLLRLAPVAWSTASFLAYLLGMTRERMPESAPLADGESLQVGELRLRVLHTPGHTPGSVCFHDATNGVLFSGDFIMAKHIGRVDLPHGDAPAMAKSLRRVLAEIPDETILLSGHTDPTTMAREKRHNPHLQPAAIEALERQLS